MTTLRRFRLLVPALLLLGLPRLAGAEVSVLLDEDGGFKRLFYLTTAAGRHRVVWAQMRPNLPAEVILNPLGDVLGDRAPVIRYHPLTGHPWVVWSMNRAGHLVIGAAFWDGKAWTAPAPVVTTPDPYYYDQVDPALAFDDAGRPFLVWARNEQVPQIYFSTLVRGVWTPPLRVSDEGIASRAPSITLSGTTAIITYETDAGTVTKTYETATLLQSAADLMDTPIPPGHAPDPEDPGGGPTTDEPGTVIKK
jgi:hypothetical protein